MKAGFYISLLFFALLAGCHSPATVSSSRQFAEWLNDDKNGCLIKKQVNGMVVEVKYLPPSFSALKELESGQYKANYDSLLRDYCYSATFLVSFRPADDKEGQDVMYRNVNNYQEYIERSMTLNFDLESKIKLEASGTEYRPVLSSLENTYGLSKGRTVYMIFSAKEKKNELPEADTFDFVYEDDIYQLGILHFVFDHRHIREQLPQVNIHAL